MSGFPILDMGSILKFVLISFRVGGVFVLSPLLSNRSVPTRVKILLVIFMSFLLMPLAHKFNSNPNISIGALMVLVFQELSIGFIIGYAVSIIFSAIQMAGDLFGLQMGFSMATIIDPASQNDSGVITSFYVIMGGLFFLYLDGHHTILNALGQSFKLLPLGNGFHEAVGYKLTDLMSQMIMFAIQIASPLLVVITVINIMFGLVSKLSPQMNIYFNIGFIIGPLVGFAILLITLPLFKVLIFSMVETMNGDVIKVMQSMKGAS